MDLIPKNKKKASPVTWKTREYQLPIACATRERTHIDSPWVAQRAFSYSSLVFFAFLGVFCLRPRNPRGVRIPGEGGGGAADAEGEGALELPAPPRARRWRGWPVVQEIQDGGGERRQGRPDDRDRSDRREKDRRRSSRDGEDRDNGRDHRSRERGYRDRESERRSSSRSRRHDGGVDRELERARSRERARERELEREIRERESRRSKEGKESMEPEADPERDQRTVFAYQMPLKVTERDVYEFFSQTGKVRDVRLIMDRNSRRLKGVGYIEFYDVMSVPQAIALSGQLLLGQPVMVKPSETEKNLVQSTTAGAGATGAGAERKLYIGNLHFNITEEQLRQIFEPFGPVELVQLPLDLETGHCGGYGFVQFALLEHAKAAQSLNGKLDIAGRIIKVVSAVTDHVRPQDSGTNAADFDDEDGGGLTQPDFDLEIQEDVREECSKFVPVKHIYVDKNSIGWVYLRFDSAASAANCQRAMHGRTIKNMKLNSDMVPELLES
ncbi:hypothetical protein C4D60_Mb08t07320 [Musa balbisiana]|uniref:RRM domain-containing protein n=1 Tax=Musa balbisiana TaxID=52838 RepID=A0A4S8K1Z5_MUSBA|nr:hypothetical protein C4D60_Mb08t07320 [Musa balbisiana]